MGIIFTNEAKCRDCYRCVRVCPVKAIKITSKENEKVYSQVLDELCLHDGNCVLACPQNAKKVNSDLESVKTSLERKEPIAASIAPSFAAGLPVKNPHVIPSILRKLGFTLVQETAVGAELVTREQCKESKQHQISTSCPVIVNIIEKYFPELIPNLSNVVSPMIAHGIYIKKNHNNMRVAFIGPCIAKKGEAEETEPANAIDYVLGFDELWNWINDENIDIDNIAPSEFDPPVPNLARLFPLEGGMLKTASLNTNILNANSVALTGLESCFEFLGDLAIGKTKHPPEVIELMACDKGCINGPRSVTEEGLFDKKQKIFNYYNSKTENNSNPDNMYIQPELLHRKFYDKQIKQDTPNEGQINNILAQTGKYTPEDELNCGACGYNTCREKAIAVYKGIAELQMCIPYMRKRAESMSNQVINSMPNGAIIVDKDLKIIEINSTAKKLFNCKADDLIGKKLETLINPRNYQTALNKKQIINVMENYPQYDLVTREIVFPLEKEQVVVGIIVNITEEQRKQEQFDAMKDQTIERAQEVIEKQMKVTQEIAGLLGETTAETKVLLTKLIELMQENPESQERGQDSK